MSHNEIYKKFEKCLPIYAGDKVALWFPNGRNSIRVRLKDGLEYIFSYEGQQDWKFETVKSFIKNMKGGKYNG